MQLIVLLCGASADTLPAGALDRLEKLPVARHEVPACPTRRDLAFLDDILAEALPHDPTPTLDDLAARPDAPHLGAPQPDPRAPYLRDTVRLITVGTDADVAAVATYLMRRDATWVELAYVPTGESTIVTAWGLGDNLWQTALSASAQPTPLIRDDSSLVTLGVAEICRLDGTPFGGEIIIDDATLIAPSGGGRQRPGDSGGGAGADGGAGVGGAAGAGGAGSAGTGGGTGSAGVAFGVRLAASITAPGIAAVVMTGPSTLATIPDTASPRRGLFRRLMHREPTAQPGATDALTLRTGRAVQAGGEKFTVIRDGVAHPRTVDRVTFYRHLRDLQVVR